METIEVSAKKVDDAIKEGLKILGTTIDKVEYKILSYGGLFKKAKVSLSKIEEVSEKPAKIVAVQRTEKPLPILTKVADNATKKQGNEAPKKQQTKDTQPKQQSKDSSQKSSSSVMPKQEKESPKPREQKEVAKPNREQPRQNHSAPKSKNPKSDNGNQNPKSNRSPQKHRNDEQKDAQSDNNDVKRRARTEVIGEEAIKSAVDFTTELVRLMGFEAEVKTEIIDGDLIIDLVCENGVLIGYRGETLDAIEYLVSIQTNKDNEEYINIVVDSCGYRKKREKMLISMAQNAANKCIRNGRKVVMEPMNRSSRKIVHATLANYNNIFSKSEGSEPNRHIVIFFKREKQSSEKEKN